jgi:hypothetical protein
MALLLAKNVLESTHRKKKIKEEFILWNQSINLIAVTVSQ